MECVVQAKILKNVFHVMKEKFGDSHVEFNQHGLIVQGLDHQSIAICYYSLKKEYFELFNVLDGDFTCHMTMKEVSMYIRRLNDSCSICFSYKKNDHMMIMTVKTPLQGDYIRNISLFENRHSIVIPEMTTMTYNSTVTMDSVEFHSLLNVIKDADYVIMETSQKCNSLSFTAKGKYRNTTLIYDQPFPRTSDTLKLDVNESVRLIGNIHYLISFSKAKHLSKLVSLKMSNNFPIFVEYPMEERGCLTFILAPKNDDVV